MSARQKRGSDRRRVFREVGERAPLIRRKNKRIAVMKRLFRFDVIAAVNDENLLLLIAILNGGNHLRTGRSGDRCSAAPASVEIIEIDEINLFGSNDINLITVRCGSAHHDRFGKFGKFDY